MKILKVIVDHLPHNCHVCYFKDRLDYCQIQGELTQGGVSKYSIRQTDTRDINCPLVLAYIDTENSSQKLQELTVGRNIEVRRVPTNYHIHKDCKEYQIWCEGYKVTGNCSGATYFGNETGETFKEAAIKFFTKDDKHKEFFSLDTMTYWGCRLFDSEQKARESFG